MNFSSSDEEATDPVSAQSETSDVAVQTTDVFAPASADKDASMPHSGPPCGDTKTNATETDLWFKLREGMLLDHRTEEKRVRQELRWFQQNPEYWNRLAPRMQRYLPYIYQQVDDIQVRIIFDKPMEEISKAPGFIFQIHGGGFCMGNSCQS